MKRRARFTARAYVPGTRKRQDSGHVPTGQLDAQAGRTVTMPVVGSGPRSYPQDVETFNDIADVTAPAPAEPGDIVATTGDVFTVEDVLV